MAGLVYILTTRIRLPPCPHLPQHLLFFVFVTTAILTEATDSECIFVRPSIFLSVCTFACVPQHTREGETGRSHTHRGCRGLNPGRQAWRQVLLPNELSQWASVWGLSLHFSDACQGWAFLFFSCVHWLNFIFWELPAHFIDLFINWVV